MTPCDGARLRARMNDTGAHPAVVDRILTRRTIEAVLRDDAHHFGTAHPGRDYRAEAAALAPLLVRALIAPALLVRLDPTTAAEIAATPTAHPAVAS
jgi:hypothetical protein